MVTAAVVYFLVVPLKAVERRRHTASTDTDDAVHPAKAAALQAVLLSEIRDLLAAADDRAAVSALPPAVLTGAEGPANGARLPDTLPHSGR